MIPLQVMLRNNNFATNYARDIERYWKYKESQRPLFRFDSPQLSFRNYLIVWLKDVSEKVKVSYRTVHLAVYILDTFMDKHSINKDRLGFVALVCLMLAAKFEETDLKVPRISELNKYDGCRYSTRDFIRVEALVLRCMNFGLMHPTVAHFVEYYTAAAVIPNDLRTQRISMYSLCENARNVISELMDVSLKEVKFLQHPPSKVAAACVLCARKRMNLDPLWTQVLISVTGYTEDSLKYCATLLSRKLKENNRRKHAEVFSPDKGYISDTF